jgi:tetratricopeptide (TPR) repeat protein
LFQKTVIIHERMKSFKYIVLSIGILLFFSEHILAQKKQQNTPETVAQKEKRFAIESLLADGMKYMSMEEYVRADTALRKALGIDPNIAALNYTMAQLLVKQRRHDEAAIYAQKAYENTPDNKFYALQLADINTHQRKYDKAADLYQAVIKQNPDDAEYGIELAAVYLLDNKLDNALKAYNTLEKNMGIDEDIIHQKQRIYIKLNKIDNALEESDKLIASDPTESRFLVEKAKLLLMNNRNADADKTLKRALEINPDDSDVRVMLADMYRQSGDSKAANSQMDKLFKNTNGDIDVKMQALVQMMREAKDPEATQEILKRAEEIARAHPKDYRVHTVYGDLLDKANRKAEARDAYLNAASLNPSVSQLWAAILELDSRLDQLDSLIVHSDRALEVFPNDGVFWFWNGTAYLGKRNYPKAVEGLEEAQKLTATNKELSKVIVAQLGDAYHGVGEHQKSDEAYENALKIDPNNDYVLNNYSYFLSLRKQKLDVAQKMAARVVERNPTNTTYLDTFAWVLYVSKDYKQAKVYLEKAVNSGKRVSATITEHYGDVLYQLGEKDAALIQWQKAKEMGNQSVDLEKKISTKKISE